MPVLKQNDVYAGRYELSQLIGEGGFSEVWKAYDQMADDAVVAIKIYAPNKGLDDYGLRQFRNEFSLTHSLTHPHLLRVYHYDISEGSPYLIMPYCPYGSLTSLLGEGAFTERQAALVMAQIGSALDEVHRQDPPIIHHDIKPDNILLLNPEYFMLADFGISSRLRHTLQKATATLQSQSLTVAYAAPERFDRHPSADATSDIFSLGVTLYEMCAGSVPWEGAGGQCLLKGASIPALPDRYSAGLNEILEACMSPDRSKRPTAAEIHQRGKHFLETGQWVLPKKQAAAKTAKNRVWPVLLTAAIVLLLAAGGFWGYTQLYLPATANTSKSMAASRLVKKPDPQAPAQKAAEGQLETKIKTMEAQLVEANEKIVRQDSINKLLAEQKEPLVAEAQDQPAISKENMLATPKPDAAAAREALKANKLLSRRRELQRNLNQISDPQHSRTQRSGWKQETLAQFANGSARVLDESDGNLQEYSASVFLTLLLTSPHQVVVKEVKLDQENKVTEIRLSKQSL